MLLHCVEWVQPVQPTTIFAAAQILGYKGIQHITLRQ